MNKYSINETVIVQSKDQPQYNGQQFTICYMQHKPLQAHSGKVVPVSYMLSGCELLLAESALRKAHKKACMSYQEMLDSLNTPIKQSVSEVV